jgi:hypothetical protein
MIVKCGFGFAANGGHPTHVLALKENHNSNFAAHPFVISLNRTTTIIFPRSIQPHTVRQDDQAHQEGRRDVRFQHQGIIMCGG